MPDHQTVEKKDFFSLLATALVSFAGILSETSMNVTFPHLSKVFGLGLGTLQWITTGYLLAVAITITLGATLAHLDDRENPARRRYWISHSFAL